jgi:hypothetical protein
MKPLKFIHITKTAGTSIENIGKAGGIRWGRFHKEYGWWHRRFPQVPQDIQQKYDWFMVVRNPYTRMISEYHCRWGGVGQNTNLSKKVFNKKLKGFMVERAFRSRGDHYTPQHLYVSSKCKIHILRFENLKEEFENLMNKYKLPFKLNAHVFNNRKKFGVNDLSDGTKALIDKIYDKDFKTFGYFKDKMKVKEYVH